MASLKKVTLLVALCYLTTCDESFGLPSQLQQKDNQMRDGEDLSAEMGLDVRKLLEEAMKRIDEVDILRVLKKSLYLRLRLCFFLPPRFPGTRSPSPMDNALYSDDHSLPLNTMMDGNEDDLTPEQRLEVRVILQDALNKIDDEEILQALKSSLLLRLKLCLRVSVRPTSSPLPYPTRRRSSKTPSKIPSHEPGKPSPGSATAAKPSTENPTMAKSSPGKPSPGKLNSSTPSPRVPSEAKPQGPNHDENAQRREVPKPRSLFQMDPVNPVVDPVEPVVDPVSPAEQLVELINSENPDVIEWGTELDTSQDSTETVNGLNVQGDDLEESEYDQYDLESQINDALMTTNIDDSEINSLMADFSALNDDLNINDGEHELVSDAVDLRPI